MRLLIVADAAAASYERVPESVRGLIESADELLVVAPELPSRGHWLVSGTDKARRAADERVGLGIGHLEGAGERGPGGRSAPTIPCSPSRTRSGSSIPITS